MPQKKLTDLFVENVKPVPGKRIEYFDASFPGLSLRVGESGKKSWTVFYRIHGTLKRFTLGSYPAVSPKAARAAATEALNKVQAGVDPAAEKRAIRDDPLPRNETFGSLWRDYVELYARKNMKPRGLYVLQKTIEKDVLKKWEHLPLDTITKRHILQLIDTIVARGAHVHANRVFSKVRAIFNWAVARDRIAQSPMTGLAKPTVENDRERVLSDDEIRWFWVACDDIGYPFGPLFQALLATAQRRTEVAEMTWEEVNLPKHLWHLPGDRTKNENSHDVHLPPVALRILDSVPRRKAGLIFSVTGEDAVSGFSRAKERLDAAMLRTRRREIGLPGSDDELRETLKIPPSKPLPVEIPHWTLHDLRRTATTKMAEGFQIPDGDDGKLKKVRIAPHVVDRILNHSSGTIRGVAKIYNRHKYEDERREALDLWSDWIDRHIGAAPALQPSNVVELRR